MRAFLLNAKLERSIATHSIFRPPCNSWNLRTGVYEDRFQLAPEVIKEDGV